MTFQYVYVLLTCYPLTIVLGRHHILGRHHDNMLRYTKTDKLAQLNRIITVFIVIKIATVFRIQSLFVFSRQINIHMLILNGFSTKKYQ